MEVGTTGPGSSECVSGSTCVGLSAGFHRFPGIGRVWCDGNGRVLLQNFVRSDSCLRRYRADRQFVYPTGCGYMPKGKVEKLVQDGERVVLMDEGRGWAESVSAVWSLGGSATWQSAAGTSEEVYWNVYGEFDFSQRCSQDLSGWPDMHCSENRQGVYWTRARRHSSRFARPQSRSQTWLKMKDCVPTKKPRSAENQVSFRVAQEVKEVQAVTPWVTNGVTNRYSANHSVCRVGALPCVWFYVILWACITLLGLGAMVLIAKKRAAAAEAAQPTKTVDI